MAHSTPTIRGQILFVAGADLNMGVGDDSWWRWLETPGTTRFRLENGVASFTARREQRQGGWYWYAYRKRRGRVLKAYLGRSSDLTLERLQTVSRTLVEDNAEAAADGPARLTLRRESVHPELPSARVVSARVSARDGNLPIQVSSFVGRNRELAQVARLLSRARLLTLTGPGGIGKTRLALACARTLLDQYPDGVWVVELDALSDPALVTAAAARVFGVRGEAGVPLVESIADLLNARSALLVLDNCERLVDACAELATQLLSNCGHLQILATSREPLGAPGEQVWQVPPMTLPNPGQRAVVDRLEDSEAVHLFVERARSQQPEFELTESNVKAVAEICRRLDGLPLAIELAATHVRGLAPEQLVNRLDQQFSQVLGRARGAPPRHQTLTAAIDWSYDLLSRIDRIVFARLGVFSGGWSVEAAESVIPEDDLGEQEVLPALLRLVEKSLVSAETTVGGAMRYRFLETIRGYAMQRLDERAEADRLRDRHADYFVAMVEGTRRLTASPDERTRDDRLERDHANLQTALTWLMRRQKTGDAQRVGRALALFWLHRGYVQEGRRWVEKLLALADAQHDLPRVGLLHAATYLAFTDGDLVTAQSFAQKTVELAENLGYPALAGAGLFLLGQVARERGQYADAIERYEKGLTLAQAAIQHPSNAPQRDLAGPPATLVQLQNLWAIARASCESGHCAVARTRAAEARARADQAGAVRPGAQALTVLGLVSYRQRNYAAAHSCLKRAFDVWSSLGERSHVTAGVLTALACVERDRGRLVPAASFLGESFKILQQGGPLAMPHWLDACAGLAVGVSQPERGFRLAGAAENLYAAMGCEIERVYRFELDHWLESACDAIGAALAAEALRTGRASTRAAAIAEATNVVQGIADGHVASAEGSPGTVRDLLSAREKEVAILIGRGLTNRQIAEELVIAQRTAAHHVENILDKLGLTSRLQIARWVIENYASE